MKQKTWDEDANCANHHVYDLLKRRSHVKYAGVNHKNKDCRQKVKEKIKEKNTPSFFNLHPYISFYSIDQHASEREMDLLWCVYSFFDEVITSEEVGKEKPDKLIFDVALRKM